MIFSLTLWGQWKRRFLLWRRKFFQFTSLRERFMQRKPTSLVSLPPLKNASSTPMWPARRRRKSRPDPFTPIHLSFLSGLTACMQPLYSFEEMNLSKEAIGFAVLLPYLKKNNLKKHSSRRCMLWLDACEN